MKNMQTKERVSKVTLPEQPLSYNEWVEKYRFGKGYTAPTPYFGGNEFDTRKFGRKSSIPQVSWQNYLKMPFLMLNLTVSITLYF